MKNFLQFIILITILTAFAACRATKNIQQVIVKKDTLVNVVEKIPTHEDTMQMVNELLSKVEQNRIDFSTFSAKIKVDYTNSKGKQPDFIANIRLLKDSIIWVSLSNDIGIEGIRVLITKDSIRIMDKLANTYQVKPLNMLQEISQIPFQFSDLQNILIGNPIFFNRDSITLYTQNANGYSLLSVDPVFKNLLSINSDFQINKSKLDDNDPSLNRTCDISLTEYETKKGFLFSAFREIVISQQNKLEIQLKYKDYKLNEELTFPFTIPKKFKRIK